jgi:hypothetical protein
VAHEALEGVLVDRDELGGTHRGRGRIARLAVDECELAEHAPRVDALELAPVLAQ